MTAADSSPDEDVLALLVRIGRLRPREVDGFAKANAGVGAGLFRELLQVTTTPPSSPVFDPELVPHLMALVTPWRSSASSQAEALGRFVRQAVNSTEPSDAALLLYHVIPLPGESGAATLVSEREKRAAAAAGRKSFTENERKRVLIPALARGLIAAVGAGPYREPERNDIVVLRSGRIADVLQTVAAPREGRNNLRGELRGLDVPPADETPRTDHSRWIGPVWAWWFSPPGEPADKFRYVADHTTRAGWLPKDWFRRGTGGMSRMAVTRIPAVVGDYPTYDIGVLPIDHDEVRKAETQTATYWRSHRGYRPFSLNFDGASEYPRPTRDDLDRRSPWPGLIVVHVLVITSDGWIVASHRQSRPEQPAGHWPAYFPDRWSLSFEEQAWWTAGNPGDLTVAANVQRGLQEELNVTVPVQRIRCHLLGREFVPIEGSNRRGDYVLNVAAFCTASLYETLETVVEQVATAPDRDEHKEWTGVRVRTEDELITTLNATRWDQLVTHNSFHPTGPIRWHPTSRARLALCGLGNAP